MRVVNPPVRKPRAVDASDVEQSPHTMFGARVALEDRNTGPKQQPAGKKTRLRRKRERPGASPGGGGGRASVELFARPAVGFLNSEALKRVVPGRGAKYFDQPQRHFTALAATAMDASLPGVTGSGIRAGGSDDGSSAQATTVGDHDDHHHTMHQLTGGLNSMNRKKGPGASAALDILEHELHLERAEARASLTRVDGLTKQVKRARKLQDDLRESLLLRAEAQYIGENEQQPEDEAEAEDETMLMSDGTLRVAKRPTTAELGTTRKLGPREREELRAVGGVIGLGEDTIERIQYVCNSSPDLHWTAEPAWRPGGQERAERASAADADGTSLAHRPQTPATRDGVVYRTIDALGAAAMDRVDMAAAEAGPDAITRVLLQRPGYLTTFEVEKLKCSAILRATARASSAYRQGLPQRVSDSGVVYDKERNVYPRQVTAEDMSRALGGFLRLQAEARLLGPTSVAPFSGYAGERVEDGGAAPRRAPPSRGGGRGALPPVEEPAPHQSRRNLSRLQSGGLPLSPTAKAGGRIRPPPAAASVTSVEALAAIGDSTTPRCLRPGVEGVSADEIRRALGKSTARLDYFSRSVSGDIEGLSMALPIEVLRSSSANALTDVWAVKRLTNVLTRLVRVLVIQGFSRWVGFAAFRANVVAVEKFRLVRGARRLGTLFRVILDREFLLSFQHWHARTVGYRDRELYSAAVECSRMIRGFVGYRRAFHWRRYLAARQIQRMGRGLLARKRVVRLRAYLRDKNAVRVIEEQWSNTRMRRAARRLVKERRQDVSALKIECMVRCQQARAMSRRQALWKRRDAAARMIQRLARGAAARHSIEMLRGARATLKAVEDIQRLGRGYLGRQRARSARHDLSAALLVQKLYKRYLIRRRQQALVIQRVWRGSRGRRKARRRRKWLEARNKNRDGAARKIQNRYRCHRAQKLVRAIKAEQKREADKAATSLQRVRRGQKDRRRFQAVKKEKVRNKVAKEQAKAASAIQKRARGRKARQEVTNIKEEKHMSLKVAMLLQRICRGRKARKVFKRKVKARERAVGKTASPYWKMDAIYKARQEEEHGKPVRRIQNMLRVVIAKRTLRHMRAALAQQAEWKLKEDSIRKIQNMVRARWARQRVEVLRQEMLDKKKAEALREQVRRNQSAMRIQGMVRTWIARKVFGGKIEELRRREATRLLQRVTRGWLSRTRFKEIRAAHLAKVKLESDRFYAAVRIQALVRGVEARVNLKSRLETEARAAKEAKQLRERNSAIMIQCAIRQKLSRKARKVRRAKKRAEEEARKRDEELERQLARLHEEQEQELFAIRIQCCARRKFARRRVREQRAKIAEEQEARQKAIVNNAAATIQALVKGVQTRGWYQRSKEELRQRQVAMRQIMVLKRRAEEEVQSLEDRAAYLEKYGPADEVTRGLQAVTAEEEEYFFMEQGSGGGGYAYDAGGYDAGAYGDATADGGDGWSQQYDENAQSYYWFNQYTGEASWTDPYG